MTPKPDGYRSLLSVVASAIHEIKRAMSGLHENSENMSHLSKRLVPSHVAEACMLPILVCLSGLFTGLTLAYFSVDQTKLRVLAVCGKAHEQVHARRILSLRKDSYLLLTTLVLFNVIANESIPVVTNGLISNRLHSVLISTAIILTFVALIPQCVCSRYALSIGGWMARFVRYLIWIAFPVTWPIAKLLELVLGTQHPPLFHRTELRELIRLHSSEVEGELDDYTTTMTWNALTLSLHTAGDAMVPMEKVFMIPFGGCLDYKTFCQIQEAGWSRIVVYAAAGRETMRLLMGYILSKNLILENPHKRTPMDKLPVYELPLFPINEPLTNILHVLLERQRHMALVYDLSSAFSDDDSEVVVVPPPWRQRLMRKLSVMVRWGSPAVHEDDDPEKANKLGQRSCASPNMSRFNETPEPSRNATPHPSKTVTPIGIITLEDVMEKLLGQTIRDESDGASRRYPRALVGRLNRVASLPTRPSSYNPSSLDNVARTRLRSSHFSSLATVEESIPISASCSTGTIAHPLESCNSPNPSGNSSTNSISTQGSDGQSTRKSFRSKGQNGLTAVYVPDRQWPGAKNLTGGLKRSRSSRRYSHREFGGGGGVEAASLVRQRLGLGSPPPSSHQVAM